MSSLYQKYVARRHRRKKDTATIGGTGSTSGETHTAAVATGRPGTVQIPMEDFVKVYGNLMGLIVDENGLDVIYWRRLNGIENKRTNDKLPKGIRDEAKYYDDDNEDGDGEGDKGVVFYKGSRRRDKRTGQIQESTMRKGNSSSFSSSFSSRHSSSSLNGQIHLDIQENRVENSKSIISSSTRMKTFHSVGKPETQSQHSDPLPLPPHLRPLQARATINAVPPPPAPLPPPPPPPPLKKSLAPPPPPAKKAPVPPPPPLKHSLAKEGPPTKPPTSLKDSALEESGSMANQVKLKPLHWDKVNPETDHSMVWHKMDRGSFNFDSDLMEALFGYVATNRKAQEPNSVKPNSISSSALQTYILDPRKSQNIAIVLKSLAMSRKEILDILLEGQEIEPETLEKLARIAPTQEEQTKILNFSGDQSELADAETFLLQVLRRVPYAFKRLNAMIFKSNFMPEINQHKGSLKTLESASKELRERGLFVKLLEAILKAGNKMNAGTSRGNAQAFNLMALRKLSDVKSVDGKTTLLHFVVQEVVRSEGKRFLLSKKRNECGSDVGAHNSEELELSKEEQEKEYVRFGLPVVAGLSAEFSNVKKSASIDHDTFAATCSGLGAQVRERRQVLSGDSEGDGGFLTKMRSFLDLAEEELKVLSEEEGRVMECVKRTTEYYQAGASKDKNKFQLFVIIKDFLGIVDQVCTEIARDMQKKKNVADSSSGSSPSPGPRHAVRFPILPPNFMSEMSSQSSSSGSDKGF